MMPLSALKPAKNMPNPASKVSVDAFRGQHLSLVRSLHAQAGCARWGLSELDFAGALWRSAEKRFQGSSFSGREVEDYLKSLHLEDLALACACALGMDAAWEFFVAHFREYLRHAASAMLRASGHADDARAAELADSLHAELYGVRPGADGQRKSLFEYFHGRSKLSTWLRAVLAQRQVDLLRATSREVPLDAEIEDEDGQSRPRFSHAGPGPVDPHRGMYISRIDHALREALAELAPRERMILACYYVDELTLAQIGRMLNEHESTVSRQLERLRRGLRDRVTRELRREIPASNGQPAQPALDKAQIEVAFEYAQEDWPFDLAQSLSAAGSAAEKPSRE
jgi:RNA polymerase sigma-70 factor